ncbi:MAG: anti-sigma factor antagonist [Chloroflexi bacterium]|nr:MAG: anti-sigma factor antagonist [Chloroflexota bacterium]MBA4375210.1 anti-sigma factor antagonist [Anaerolinea sp.]
MEIFSNHYKHCDVVKVTGRLDSSTAPKLVDQLSKITDENRFKIVMDFSQLDFISSAGLRVLISTLKNCKRYNRGTLVLAGLTPHILSVFDLAGFTAIFNIYPDVISAVGSF